MWADAVNGTFELVGALALSLNVIAVWRDRGYAGVRVLPVAFFASWGVWNLYYYPSLGQWWSFAGGVAIVAVNAIWFALMLYYGRKTKSSALTLDDILADKRR